MQPANFDLDPINVLTGRMVKTEKTLDYFIRDDFGRLAQVTNLSFVFFQGTVALSWSVMVFRILDPSTKIPFLVLL